MRRPAPDPLLQYPRRQCAWCGRWFDFYAYALHIERGCAARSLTKA